MGERQRTGADELHAQIERLKAERDSAWNDAIEAAAVVLDNVDSFRVVSATSDDIRKLKRGAAAHKKEEGHPLPIYTQRVAAGLTLLELARKLGWTTKKLGDMEWGRVSVSDEGRELIHQALSLNVINKTCKGCGKYLLPANVRAADGCPCNSPRGVNHGLVPKDTCTCAECDPEQTGGTRYPVEEP